MQAFHFVDQRFYGAHGSSGDMITRSLNVLLIVVSVALFARGKAGTKAVGSGANIALGLAGFLLCSVLWSVARGTTIREGLIYLPMIVGSIGIASNFDPDEYMHLLARTYFCMALLSLVVLAHSSADTVGVPWDDFQGIFSQKNQLGEAMQIGALASLHGLRTGNGRRLGSAVYLSGFIVLALMSASTTSCVIIFAYSAASVLTALVRKGGAARFLGIVGAVIALPALLYVLAFPDSFIEALGKNPTLTGRTAIWAAAVPYIWHRPVLGWGFMAFWSPTNPVSGAISAALGWGWLPNEAHNGLYEALLEVGVVGTAFFLFLMARNIATAIRCLRTAEAEIALTCLLSCAGVLMLGVSEEVLVVPLAASTSIFFITGFMCEKAVRTAARREASQPQPVESGDAVVPLGVPSGSSRVWRSRRGEGAKRVIRWRRRGRPRRSGRGSLPSL